MQSTSIYKFLITAVAAAALAACGGGGGGDSTTVTPVDPTPPTTPTSKFTKTGVKWTFDLPASGSLCYDFDAAAQTTDCSGTAWDVKVVSGGRTASLYTNSGPSGTGQGAAQGRRGYRQGLVDLPGALGKTSAADGRRLDHAIGGDGSDNSIAHSLKIPLYSLYIRQ